MLDFFMYGLIIYASLFTVFYFDTRRKMRLVRRTLLLIAGMRGYELGEDDQEEYQEILRKNDIQSEYDFSKMHKEGKRINIE